jgi:c-di-GMP-binding flagellar brake protein YcgR
MERRRQYRVSAEGGGHEIFLSGMAGEWKVPAELVNLTAGGAQLKVSVEHDFPAAVARSLTVWLCDRGSGIELPIEAKLVHRREEGENRVLGVSFLDLRTLGGLLHPMLGKIFNRRAALRVTPSRLQGRIGVTVVAPPSTNLPIEEAQLVDISTGGLAMDVPLSFEEGLAGQETVDVLFRLPAAGPALGAAARIVHRTLRNEGVVRYGVQFLHTEEETFKPTRDAILGYVIRRQREMAEENELMSGGGIPLGALSKAKR